MHRLAQALFLLSAVVMTSVLVGGCDNRIDPISGDAQLSIYGALSLSADQQYVRVRDLTTPLTPEATRQLDVEVTLERLRDGARFPMRESVVLFDSVYTHNFYRNIALEPEAEYRVIAEHADGRTTSATARMPPILQETKSPAFSGCRSEVQIRLDPVPDIRTLDIALVYQYSGSAVRVEPGASTDDLFSFGAQDGGAVITFQPETLLSYTIPSQDDPDTRFTEETRCSVLDDDRIRLLYLQYSPQWLSSGRTAQTFDPTESKTVTNGLGFLGGIRRDSTFVRVDTSV